MQDSPGEWVGQGRTYLITDAQWPMNLLTHHDPTRVVLTTQNGPDVDDRWRIDLSRPSSAPLTTGPYPTSTTPTGNQLYLDVSSQGAGCGTSTGTTTIRQISFNPAGQLTRST
jgi:hypothetical protein